MRPTQSREGVKGGLRPFSSAPCRVKGQRPLWGLGQRPNGCSCDQLCKSTQSCPTSAEQRSAFSAAVVISRVLRRAPNLLFRPLAHCRAKWARPTSMGEGFLSMLVFFVAGEKRRAYPTAIEKPRQPLDNRPCVLPGLLCSWKMCYACSNCELYSSA